MIEKILLLSGTPGTGKTSISKYIRKKYNIPYISLSVLVKEKGLYSEVDEERDSKIVDEDRLIDYIDDLIEKGTGDLIIEGHYADLIENNSVYGAVVLRCHPQELEKRLKGRDYPPEKISENIQSELVASCTSYMLENDDLKNRNLIWEIDTSKHSIEQTGDIIMALFLETGPYSQQAKNLRAKYRFGKISWLSDISVPRKFFIT